MSSGGHTRRGGGHGFPSPVTRDTALWGSWNDQGNAQAPYYSRDATLSERHIYVRSNWLSGGTVINGTYPGSDANDGLTSSTPLQTLQEVYRRYPIEALDGAQVVIHLAGGDGANNGFDGPCTQALTYRADTVIVGCGSQNRQAYRYVGPKGMLTVSTPGAATWGGNFNNMGRYQFSASFGGTDSLAQYMLKLVDGSGNLVIPECPIQKNDSNGVFLPFPGGSAFVPVGCTGYIVQPAVHIVSVDPGGIDGGGGTLVIGQGPILEGRFVSTIDTSGQPHTFERIACEKFGIVAAGHVSFDRCTFDQNLICAGGSVGFYNCKAVSNVFWWCNGRSLGADRAADVAAAHADSASSPTYPQSGIDLQIFYGQLFIGGVGGGYNEDDGGHHSGHARFFKGIAIRNPGGTGFGAIHCTDHSSFYQDDNCYLVIEGANVGVQVRGAALARVKSGSSSTYISATTALRNESTAATIAEYANATIWNNNFAIYTPASAGVPPSGGFARIYQ